MLYCCCNQHICAFAKKDPLVLPDFWLIIIICTVSQQHLLTPTAVMTKHYAFEVHCAVETHFTCAHHDKIVGQTTKVAVAWPAGWNWQRNKQQQARWAKFVQLWCCVLHSKAIAEQNLSLRQVLAVPKGRKFLVATATASPWVDAMPPNVAGWKQLLHSKCSSCCQIFFPNAAADTHSVFAYAHMSVH